ncbi:DUF1178 family protein [Marinivivus vitaminiproducens]|uniref:DUF1178 family protein n=1 Tax=Marinivivus vitaminiproducens TaxID=3035935 RepID=UPI0027AA39F8|nr:DUF1178 family protein [Geminicoccaceae bacterium SCSIO 64248]
MIRYDLRCSEGHAFNAWFRDAGSFEAQVKAGDVACPHCGSEEVAKALMAPAIGGRHDEATQARADVMRHVRALQEHVERTCEPVGERFAEEARRIHYGEAEQRGIYGQTSPDEARSLKDEGIAVARLPWLPKRQS